MAFAVKTIGENLEKKVEKVIVRDGSDRFDAVIYREVDPGGITQQYLLHLVYSGEMISSKDIESLMEYLERHGPTGHA
jgi:hypothetical protein